MKASSGWSYRFAFWLLRLGLWGLPEEAVADMRTERAVDLAEQGNDPLYGSPAKMLRRAAAGLFWDVWLRLFGGTPTLVARGVVLSGLALFGMFAAVYPMVPSVSHSIADVATSVGVGVLAVCCFVSSQRLALRWLRLASGLLVGADILVTATIHPHPGDVVAQAAVWIIAGNAVTWAGVFLATFGGSLSPLRFRRSFRAASVASLFFAVLELYAGLFRTGVPTAAKVVAIGVGVTMLLLASVMWDMWKFYEAEPIRHQPEQDEPADALDKLM